MIAAQPHAREAERLQELDRLRILDTESERDLDALAELARDVTGFPIALISLVDANRQWFKSCLGLPATFREGPRETAFCAHAILESEPFLIEDAEQDERFADNPLVTGPPFVRAYAGVPLMTRRGLPVGTLCVVDSVPRRLTGAQVGSLKRLASVAASIMERRRLATGGGEAATAAVRPNGPDASLQGGTPSGEQATWSLIEQRRRSESGERPVPRQGRGMDAVLEALASGLHVVDPGRRLWAANRQAFQMVGLESEAVLRSPDPAGLLHARMAELGVLGEGDAEARLAAFTADLAAGRPVVHRSCMPDGTWVECIARPVPGHGSVVLLRDITEVMRARRDREHLQHVNALLKRAVDAAASGVAVLDAATPGLPIVYWNAAALSFQPPSGARRAHTPGIGWRRLIGPAPEPAEAVARVDAALAAGKAVEAELWVDGPDGRQLYVDLRMSPIVGEGGQAEHFVAVLSDTTARHELLAELHSAHAEAIRASQAKSEFLANVSHEVRTPLNGIIGMTGLLLGSKLDPEQRHFAEISLQSAEMLLSVINDILDVAKLEANRVELECIEFELAQTVENVVGLVAGRAAEKGIELAIDVAPEVRTTYRGDPTRLSQVLLNLVGNAVKFTTAGHVLASARATDGGIVRFEVSDTGPGIEAAALERLFEKFTQADASVTRRYGGTGLGLAIARQITELMGGRIGVETVLGQGSTFWVEVPLAPCPAAMPRRRPPVAELAGRRALLVDDLEVNRSILRRQLADLALDCEVVADGFDALALIERATATGRGFDVALLDQMMPLMSGVTLARRLRANPAAAGLRLILASSAADPLGAADRALFDVVLTKPVRHRDLEAALVNAFATSAPAEGPVALAQQSAGDSARRSGRVLVVEDNPVNREIAVRLLTGAGHQVASAADGGEAVAAVTAAEFDMVLMDVEMPGMDGLEALRRIRAMGGRCKELPVIAVTAHAMAGTRDRMLAAGMTDYLAKPYRAAELLAMVVTHLGRGTPADPAIAEAPVASVAVAPVLNEEILAELARLPAEGLGEIIAGFEAETARQLAVLVEALEHGAPEAARQAAHRLVGGYGMCGAPRLADIAQRIELASPAETRSRIELAQELQREHIPTLAKLKRCLGYDVSTLT